MMIRSAETTAYLDTPIHNSGRAGDRLCALMVSGVPLLVIAGCRSQDQHLGAQGPPDFPRRKIRERFCS